MLSIYSTNTISGTTQEVHMGVVELTIVTVGDESDVSQINQINVSNGGEPGRVTRQRGMLGTTEDIFAIAAVLNALPALIDATRRLIEQCKVKELSVGDSTIENPTPGQAEQLLRERQKDKT
jgi:hypothetical protein